MRRVLDVATVRYTLQIDVQIEAVATRKKLIFIILPYKFTSAVIACVLWYVLLSDLDPDEFWKYSYYRTVGFHDTYTGTCRRNPLDLTSPNADRWNTR